MLHADLSHDASNMRAPRQLLNLQNILIATDFSECSTRIIGYALGIAARYQAKVHLFHWVDPMAYNLVGPDAVCAAVEASRREMRELEERLRGGGRLANLPTETLVEEAGDLSDILPGIVRARSVDLIIVGTHGRTGFKRFALGSVAEKIVREAPCPVLTVGPHVYRSRIEEAGPENILLATDLSRPSRMADLYAFSLACRCRAQLVVLDIGKDDQGAPSEETRAQWCRERLAELGTNEGDLVPKPKWLSSDGPAVDTALQRAEENSADLIVFMVKAPYQLTNRLLQTDAYRVVCESPCPVLTVHSD